jgi:hypothetical protein
MKYVCLLVCTSLLLLVSIRSAAAQSFGRSVAVGATAGTMGFGVQLSTPVTPRFNLRVGANTFTYSRSDVLSDFDVDVRVDSDLKLSSMRALVDFLPTGRMFRLTGGLIFNGNEGAFLVTPTENYVLNEKEFTPERIGSLRATVGHKSRVNPYLGIGLGNPVSTGGRLGITFDLGVLYTSSPRIEMNGDGMIAPTTTQAPQLERDLEGIKVYPLLAVGLSFRIL